MKKVLPVFAFTFLLSTFSFAQQYGWESLNKILPNAHYSDVFAIGNEVWITSGSSTELFYNDAVGTTDFVTYATPDELLCLHMLNSNEGYAGAQNGRVYRTINGGANWTLLLPPTGASVNDISFSPTNNDTGYICGEAGRVYSISATGTSQMNSGVVSNMSSVFFPSDAHGWVCGEDVIKHYTSESGQWNFDQNYPGNLFCCKIFFTNDTTGWIVGAIGDNGAIIHTTNGINWTYQTDPNPSGGFLNSVFFLNDGLHGWAAGNFGKVLITSDGGENWNELEIGSGSLLRGIYFTSLTNGFVVGNNGEAFRYGLPTGIEESYKPQDFLIFPNPATEKFRVPLMDAFGKCSEFKVEGGTIEIYDLTGKKLLEKQISAGTEIKEIDVSHLKNGVYFCRLVSEKYSATKKLIIQK